MLLTLLAELYERKLSDVIAVKEWLQAKLEEEPRCTNDYLCPKDDTRWDAGWSCMANDRCPTCDDVVQPYGTTRNEDGSQGDTLQANEQRWRQYVLTRPPLVVEYQRLSGTEQAKVKKYASDIEAWKKARRWCELITLPSRNDQGLRRDQTDSAG